MDASHPSRLPGRIMTALCAAVVLFVGAINVAGAQTAPSPAPSAAPPAGGTNPGTTPNNPTPPNMGGQSQPQASPVPKPKPVAKPLPPLSHLPIIDFVVTFTQPAYYNSRPSLPGPAGVDQLGQYDPIDLGGTVRIPVTRKLNLLFDRITEGTINQPLERSFVGPSPGTVVNFPRDSRDVILQYHATYAFDRFVSMDIGDSFRHRIQSFGGAGGGTLFANVSAQPFPYTLSSTEHHFGYLGFSYTTKPVKELLRSTFVFSETLDVQNVDHHVAVLCNTAANKALPSCAGKTATQVGYLDENPNQARYYETTQGISMIVPVDPKHGTSFLLNERWGYLNFYENAAAPYRWNSATTYQLSKRFSPGFTLALRHSDLHASSTQSVPFTAPNAIHVGSWDIIGTFHVDTNTFFH